MMPSSRFVVSRFPALIVSIRRGRALGAARQYASMRGPAARIRLRARGVELTHHAKTVIRHFPDFFDRLLEPCEFAAEVIHRRLDPIAKTFAGVGKEEVTRRGADERA